ncbi:hypothetical protein GOP47_0020465 [Adiantum capillus-veneris]|uniref:Uncharacterized protein n=1 Tax=Adiantum capillus-veneris TaxID=13818 RepID=A0A9D4U9R9_ADICA|nr:hypothetical protein GOP47_0020465 [Adiantum capillus-veneris]
MSDWEVDDVAGSTWSSLDEVAWIECENKISHIEPQPGTHRGVPGTSIESFPKGITESPRHDRRLPDGNYQRLHKTNASPKSDTFKERNTQESGYSGNNRTVSSGKGDWYDYTPGRSLTAPPLNALDKSGSARRGVHEEEAKKEISEYSFEEAQMCKGELIYNEEGADVVNSPCHFLLSEMCPPGGDLEFLAEVQEEVRRDNLLEFGWGNTNNLEDMDRLFSSTDSIISRSFNNNSGMLWEPPSPTLGDSLESLHRPVTMPLSPEFVTRDVTKSYEAKTELVISKSSAKKETVAVSEEWRSSSHDHQHVSPKQHVVPVNDSCLPMQIDSYTDRTNGSNWESQGATAGQNRGSDCMENESTHAQKQVNKWKTNKGKRHGPRSKRLEDTARKSATPGQKVALNLGQANSSPLMFVPIVPIAQDSAPTSAQLPRVSSCEPIVPMQCLQPVPYVHAGFGFPTHHHLPVVVPTPSAMQQQLQPPGQPVFISYQPQFIEALKLQQSKGTFDVSSQSPTASSTMTPQEKIEKLRWRQKMQARLAVEQQQQQLINQRLIPEQAQFARPSSSPLNHCEEVLGGPVRLAQSQCAEPLNWNGRPSSLEGAMLEDGDESLAAIVLHQLLNIASKMDTRTRLCLRDGFGRLARNARQRRAAGDSRGLKRNSELIHRSGTAESSSSSEQSCSQRLLTVDDIVETETNPMDRFIAHLLFHKRFPSSYTNLNMHLTPCSNSETSEAGALQPNGWTWSEGKHLSPVTRSSSVTGEVEISKGASAIADVPPSDNNMCGKAKIQSARLSQPIVSGLQLENALNFSTVSPDNSLQQLVEREPGIADIGLGVVPSTGHMDISDGVAEPQLQANHSKIASFED